MLSWSATRAQETRIRFRSRDVAEGDDTGPAGPASISLVARRAGVSIATVSRVVNGIANKASAETVERVLKAVAELDYRPSSAGKSLRQKRSRLVAVLAANMSNPTMAAIAASAEIALREEGLVMVLCDTHDRPDLQDEYLREMRAQQARAIVLLGAVESALLASFRAGPAPLVFVNRRDPGNVESTFVGIDNDRAGRDVARHCMSRGLFAPAIVHAALSSSATRDRVDGIRRAYAEAGHPIPPGNLRGPIARDHLRGGYEAARQLVADGDRFDCLICAGDLIAFGAHRYLETRRPSIDLPPIFGFDDNPMNAWVAPWLSSVRIPYDAFGAAIVEAILQGRDGPKRQWIFDHQLVIRDGRVEPPLP